MPFFQSLKVLTLTRSTEAHSPQSMVVMRPVSASEKQYVSDIFIGVHAN